MHEFVSARVVCVQRLDTRPEELELESLTRFRIVVDVLLL